MTWSGLYTLIQTQVKVPGYPGCSYIYRLQPVLVGYIANTDLRAARAWLYNLTPKAEGYITKPWLPEGLYWLYD